MNWKKGLVIASVGWYLMVPPASNLQAPISQWCTVGSFDKMDGPSKDNVFPMGCSDEASRWVINAELREVYIEVWKENGTKIGKIYSAMCPSYSVESIRKATCIASDDPRLAK